MTLLTLVAGLILSSLVAALAYQRGSLDFSGSIGAVLIGTAIFAGGGLGWGLLLIAFFVTSSALSHYQARTKQPLADKFQKGHRRDLGQVLANGLSGAVLALAYGLYPSGALFIAYAGAIATVNADTWATELGVLSKAPPRLITTGRIAAVGTSGGVTWLGTIAALAGAVVIAAGVLALWIVAPGTLATGDRPPDMSLAVVLVIVAGLAGSLFDSLLGATAQAIYYCDYCGKETESALHRCGHATRLVRGWRRLDNDMVNFLSSVVGGGLAAALYWTMTGAF